MNVNAGCIERQSSEQTGVEFSDDPKSEFAVDQIDVRIVGITYEVIKPIPENVENHLLSDNNPETMDAPSNQMTNMADVSDKDGELDDSVDDEHKSESDSDWFQKSADIYSQIKPIPEAIENHVFIENQATIEPLINQVDSIDDMFSSEFTTLSIIDDTVYDVTMTPRTVLIAPEMCPHDQVDIYGKCRMQTDI